MTIQDQSKIFLNLFTKELIANLKLQIEHERKKTFEEERRLKAIEVEKLKKKFASYEQKHLEKEVPQIIEIPQEKMQPSIVAITPKIEVKPEPKPQTIEIQKPSLQKVPLKKPVHLQKELPITKIPIPPQPPIAPGEVDFGKVGFLVRDHLVVSIECPGENKNILVKRAGTTTKNQITLTKEEIMKIITSFSDKAKIPLIEGMLDARIGDIEMSAIVSETISPSFIIKRILVNVVPSQPTLLEKPMMQFSRQEPLRQAPMPPINRPFTPAKIPNQNPSK